MNLREEKLASILVSLYPIRVDERIIERAVKSDMFDVLKVMWKCNINYNTKFKNNYSFDYLISKINDCMEGVQEKVEKVCKWKIKTKENLLR